MTTWTRLAARVLKHRLAQDALVLYGVQFTGYILPLITLPYLTRVLGPSNFGLLALGGALAMYFQVVTEYGFAVTGTRGVAAKRDDPAGVNRIYSTVMACKVALFSICFLALVMIVWATPKLHGHWELYMVSFLLVIGWGLSPNWLFQGLQRMKLVAASDYGAKIVSVGLIFLLVRSQPDYVKAATLQYGAFLVSALIGLSMMFLVVRIRLVRPAWGDMKRALREGWPVFLSMASMTVMSSSNTLLLGAVGSSVQVGYYSAAARLVIAIRALANPINTAVFPHVANRAARSREQALTFLRRNLILLNAPFLAGSVLMFFLSPMVVRLAYGVRFAETGVVLRILSGLPVVYSLEMFFGNYYMLAFGYEKAWSKVVQRNMVLNFVAIYPLMKFLGPARGVAATMMLTDTFALLSYLWFYWKTDGPGAPNCELAAAGRS
jgi:PST family polysaccharide transporter